MIFQVGATAFLLLALAFCLAQRKRAAAVTFLGGGACAAGLYLVWFPDDANALAHQVGIGRGADLVFYCWTLLSFVLLLNVHLRLREQGRLLTELARKIAIAGAEPPAAAAGDEAEGPG